MKHWKKRLLTDINCYIVFQGKTESWNEKWVDDIILLLVRSESEKPVIKAVQVRKHLRGISWVHIENVPSFFFYITVLLLRYNQTFLSSLGVWKKFNIDWSQTRECMTKSIESVFSLTDQQSPNILPFTYHRSGVVGLWLTEDKKEWNQLNTGGSDGYITKNNWCSLFDFQLTWETQHTQLHLCMLRYMVSQRW